MRPHAHDHIFFYGVNFEFSVNYLYWEPRHVSSEVRPIVGLHLHPVDIIFNPIVDTLYRGGFGSLEFVPRDCPVDRRKLCDPPRAAPTGKELGLL